MAKRTQWWCVKEKDRLATTRCPNRLLSNKHLSIHFFYIENESILIRTPNGKNILYDCGKKSASEHIHERLTNLGIDKLDVVIASHMHSDHAGGFYWFWNLKNENNSQVTIKKLYDSGEDNISDDWFKDEYKKFRKHLKNNGSYYPVRGKVDLTLDKDVDISLYADDTWNVTSESSRKYRSVWMTIRYKKATMLFEGDTRRAYENRMLERFTSIDKAHLLKLSEHGSADSNQPKLLDAIDPAFALVCNKDHIDLPAKEVKDRLSVRKIRLFDTGYEKSDIVVSTDGILKEHEKVEYQFSFHPFPFS